MPSKEMTKRKGDKHSTEVEDARYSSLHPIRLAWAAAAFGAMLLLDKTWGIGSNAMIAAGFVALGTFLLVPPVKVGTSEWAKKRKAEKQERAAELKLQESSREIEIVRSVNAIDANVLPEITNTGISADTHNVLEELRWIERRWDDLVDEPQQMAIVKNIATVYLPDTLQLALKNQADRNRGAIDSTRQSLGILEGELRRIKTAILSNRVSELESHEGALRRQFGTAD